MLQPRDIQQHYGIPLLRPFRIVLCIALICIGTGLAQYSDDVYIVEPTPALRLNNQDLTTIFLLNNNNNNNSNNRGVPTGRHINVKPTLGLLTSTARTFIQEGVTTEYATQVVGTTLDNGRVYAQLLKKSSRVLYDKDKPTTIAPTAKFPGAVQSLQTYSAKNPKMLLQSHNDIIGDKDWQLIDDHLLLVNKDSNGGKFGRIREQTVGENGRQSLLVFPVKSFNQDQESSNLNAFGNTSFTVSSSSSSSSSSASSPAGIGNNINAHKVLSAHNLPTFTIKNVFAPSGFSWDSPIDQGYLVDENLERISKVRVDQQQRTPKLLQHDTPILSNEFRNMATVTYFGFADFTTVVGDTVIVFSPSTSAEMPSNGHITSIKGEATLNHIPQETAFVTHVPITVTQDLIEPTFTMQHVVGTVDPTEVIRPHLNHQESEAEADQSEISMPGTSEDYGSDDESASAEEYATTTEEESPLDTTSRNEPQFELEPSSTLVEDTFTAVTQPTSETSTKVMLSRPSNEDISKIFASLASAEAAKKLAAQQTTQNPTTEKSIPVEPLTTTPPTTTSSESNEIDTTEQPSRESPIPVTDRPIENEVTTSDSKEESLSSTEHMPTVPEKPADEPESIPSLEIIAPETKVSGGVTTIFFEDDPFLGLEATTTQPLDMQTTALSSSTEAPVSEITTTTESTEPENTTLEQQINENTSESTSNSPVAAAEKEELKHSNEECQDKTSEIIPTLVPKTLTYLTTFYISDAEETSTSIELNVVVTFDVSYSTKLFCEEIVSTPVVQEPVVSTSVTTVELAAAIDRPEIDEASLSSSVVEPLEDVPITTTPHMIITEKVHVTTEQTPATELNTVTEKAESDSESAEEEGDENLSEQSGEEIELIYKTLYTTYTYLTTFFQESTTSISSRKEIITNVITSTVTPGQLAGNVDADLLASIVPTAVSDTAQPTSTVPAVEKGAVGESDLEKINGIIHEDEGLGDATDSMEGKVQAVGVKTYYTTYTYFTTIFVDGETEIMSRTEIYTNYVTESADFQGVTARQEEPLEFTVSDDDNKVVNDISPTSTYAPSVQTNSVRLVEQALSESAERSKPNVDLLESSFASSSSTSSSSSESEIKMVTDVRSSSSDGDRHIIENINKHWNGLLEDQISSESNTDEILPSSTLLLQTSYTTFTYFTTMYIGNTASSILSRLETITNVVTETLQPTQMLKPEDSTLPITYFTTFTYWTTLYKDGEITTISREETVSNIVTPSAALEHIGEVQTMKPVLTVEASLGSIASTIEPTAAITTEPTIMATPVARESTTFYTTYTYFTTQYIGEETVVSSRFETVTNVVAPTAETVPATQSIGDLQPSSTVEITSTQQVELAPTSPIPPPEENIIELNQGQIVDAEGVSTLLYLTKTVSTTINDQPTTTVVSSSSLHVDQVKKALLPTTESDTSSRTYKTGLVRLIDGTIIANATTTLYQSKVIGTIIEGRYAQIIESTSSFLIEKTLDPTTSQIEITPTSVQTLDSSIIPTAFTPISSANVVEGSINEGGEEKDHESGEGDDEEEDDEESGIDDNGRPKSRLTFQAKKKTFTPVIRPFASRNRPQFAPKRKNAAAGSATIITRSDFTPTITATPALKSDSSRGRFSSNRKGSSVIASSGSPSRKFSRPSGGSTRGVASSSAFPGGSRRGFASSRIQPTASASYFGGSSRRGGSSSQRGGSSSFGRASSIYAGNSRLRIKSTSVIPVADAQLNTNIYTTQEPDTNEENVTQLSVEDQEEVEVTTESLRRANPLLSLRRPPLAGKNLGVSQRRNPLTPRPRTTTTKATTTPKPPPRSFQRPGIVSLANRQRASSGLFPPRGLFRPQTINEDLNESKKPQEEENNDFGDDLDGEEYDDEEEGEDAEPDHGRKNNIKRHARVKRQAPSFRNRFRRPGGGGGKNEEKPDPVVEEVTQRSRTTARFNGGGSRGGGNKKSGQGKNHNNNGGHGRIRPTKASSSSRAQFTLREKDAVTKPARSSSFRRPSTNNSGRRTATTVGRPKAPRLKNYANPVTESPYTSRSTSGRSRQTTSRGRATTRSRGTTEYKNADPVLPAFDGTITVTHHVPTEITIPVVNGKVTEYKNIVTAQIRTEVLAPNQYNTLVDHAGSSLLVLAREDTTINGNGATEVTQFILHETPTTSVIFTPTTIRGRKTSYSHIIPSTVYDVENVVSTIQPQIAAQAPLANILLSQLLLGNIGLQNQQINPLIGLGGQTGVPGAPMTEYKTRTTTYVTTVTNEKSTVIPLTFRGKEILTTIYDSSQNVITATEFITDTIVVTPTAAAANAQQVNSLLLPLLLQQQAQGAQQILPIQNSILPQQLVGDPLLNAVPAQQQNLFQDNDLNRVQKVSLDEFHDASETEQFPEQDTFRDATTAADSTRSRKRNHRKGNKHAAATVEPDPPLPMLETSVVTLYVSGRRPGEFSTVLSTVVGQESGLRKRNAEFVAVEKSASVDYADFYRGDESEIKDYLLPAPDGLSLASSSHSVAETQSLESIVGDVSRWVESQMDTSINPSPSTTANLNAMATTVDNSISTTPLSTVFETSVVRDSDHRVDNNEDIISLNSEDDLSESYGSGRFFNFQIFDGLQSSTPIAMADEARYNLATRVMSNGVEVIVAGDKTKTAGDRNNILRIVPSSLAKPMTLAPSTLKNQMILIAPNDSKENITIPINPNQFVTKTCLTTYTYRTTYLQDGTTTIESREKIISNIATEERNYLKISPTATSGFTLSRTPEFIIGVFHTTYTYLNTILDGELPLVLSSKHTVTNTITGPEDYISFLQPSEQATPVLETNTYYSRITMTKTLHDSNIGKIVSTSNIMRQVVITESLPSKSTSVMTSYIALDVTSEKSDAEDDLHIYATKTYLTTFTYFTTVLKSNSIQSSLATEVNSHIRVVENVITESIPNHLLEPDALDNFRNQLQLPSTRVITTLATLIGGQTLEVTAMRTPNLNQQSQLPLIGSGEVNEEHVTSAGFASLENEEEEEDDKDEKETLASDETKLEDDAENVVETIETASSDQNEQVYNALKRPSRNYTKIHDKNGLQVSNLIGSLNLNGLNALGPVINAMAGLINTNFGTPARRNYTNVKLSASEISSKNLLKNISSEHLSGNLNFDEFESDQKHLPIYIPVRSTHEILNGNRLSSPSSLHIAPPKPVQPHQQKYLLQSDEKANRDSKLEITVGKPTHETPLLNGGIPISPGEVITANSDVIIGKPAGIRPRVPYQASQNPPILPPHRPNHLVSPKVIPLLQYKQHPAHLRVPPIHGTNPYPSTNPPPPPPNAQLTPPMHYSDHAHVRIPPPFLQSPHYPDHQKPLNNEILEIKKIPEVFSADLPVFEIKKIRGSDKNMLVNIQPSQVASVMIPHGNTSPVLIIESTSELHKNGQYFDEPAPYPNTILGSSSLGELAAAEPILKPHKPALVSSQITVGGVGESANAPVQVNLDSSILSHNIDVHVPPLTFIKENEFPQSTAIRGQNAFNFQKHGQHNVNIPYYNRHVSVNIRPQHELADSPHFHRTQEYLVQGMEPPPKSLPPKKYNYFNQIPYNQHNLPQSYPPPPSSNQINVLHPYKGDKYYHQLHTLQQQQQHQLHQQQHHQLHLQQQQLNHQQQQLHHHQQHQYNTQVVELPSYGSSHAPAFDNSPIDHSQAPSIVDGITDEHREDDYENEEGEVIQESNSLPVIPGQYIDYPTSTSQASFVNVSPFLNMPSASAINELPHMTMNNSDARISAQNSHPSPTNATLPSTGHPVLFREHFRNQTLFNKGGKQRTNSSSSAEVDIEHLQIGSLSIGSSSVHNEATDSLQTYVQAPRPIESYETNSSIPHSSSPQTERPFNGNTNNESLGNNSIISNDLDGESEEIFDFKESINPHNLEVINNLEEILPSERPAGARVTLPTTIQVSTSPNQVSIESMTEEVVGMSPPPLPNLRPGPIKRKPPHPLYSSPIRSPPSTFNYPTRNPLLSYTWSTLPPRSPLRPINESTATTTVNPPAVASDEQVPSSFAPPKKNYTTTYSSVTRTPPKYKLTSKLPPVLLQATTRKPNHYFPNRRPVASVNTTSVSVSTSISSSTSRSPVTQVRLPSLVLTAKINYTDDKSKNENIEKAENKANEQNGRPDIKATPSNQYPQYIDITRTNTAVTPSASSSSSEERNDEDMLSEKQRVPDDILITGSEISVHTESHPATTSYLTHKETITVTQPVNVTTRTRLLSKIILPTKYITNTKTLTVTSTKTTVVKSQGIPSTQTLILTTTQTSTLIDTVTQTHTETLVKPTNVILDHATSTIATTFYTMPSPPPPHSPEKEPTPPDEVIADIGNDFFAKSTSEVPSPNTSPVPVIIRMGSMNRNPGLQNQSAQHDSIFVVMTDQKNIGLINLGSDRKPLSTQKNENIDHVNKALDASELPNRDEDTIHNESNHVLLGGVLIATPPKVSNSQECRPDCKGSRNELCQNLDGHMRCVCRAGFARMFPDRPCKPTYTYKLSMPLQRIGKDLLVYDDSLSNKDSESYFNLASQTHEALDRMVMQSDFRDIYHGVHVTGLERAPSGKGLVGNFYLQLSDNSDEQRLVDVFRKYLRGTNYSVGGTELYSAQTSDADDLQASDFDECLDRQFHDCSENAHCFNLHGTYTCSCKEGFADFSENPVYPGRICSAEQIGCEKCHYHGSCFSRDLDSLENVVCECFPWYAGATCQLNLKILLIGLVAFGALLLILLFFCLLITCSKRRKNRSMQAIISGINILPPKGSRLMGSRGGDDKLMKLDKRAMIKDSSSEASHSLDTLPYVASKKSYRKDSLKKQSTSETSQRHSAVSPPVDLERHCNLFDQNDRSLTVMIPRAKYHPVLQLSGDGSGLQSSNLATAEAKLLSYWDASVSNTTMPTKKLSSANGKQHNAAHTTSTGALVSAGFEVSATVGQDISSTLDSKSHLMQKSGNKTQYSSRNSIPNSESQSQYGAYKKQPAVDSHIFVDPIDAWSGTLQHTELTASEVRSYDETTIQAQTKSFLSVYDKHSAHMNNDEANTMAERDIGSTFLLPHTHLYKPDRGSDDVSGFESF